MRPVRLGVRISNGGAGGVTPPALFLRSWAIGLGFVAGVALAGMRSRVKPGMTK